MKTQKNNIIEKKEVNLINGKWKQITYDNKKINYKRYNKKHNMWVVLSFNEY